MKMLLRHMLVTLVLFVAVGHAQQPDQKLTTQAAKQSDQQPSPSQAGSKPIDQPHSEMQKLLDTFSGTWSITARYEPNEKMPHGDTAEGQEVFRPGPGGHSVIEDNTLRQATGESSLLSVTWWDEKARGYRAIVCASENPAGCDVMVQFAHWEGDKFVLGDEFMNAGKKFAVKEVVSDITPNSFTQTIYRGEAGKQLARVLTIHATRVAPSGEAGPSPK